jgi:hypothetical protein
MGIIMLEGAGTIARVRPSRALVRRTALEFGITADDAYRYLRGVTGGAGFVDTVEQAVIGYVMGKGGFTPNASNYVALSTTTPTDAGSTFTEPSTGAYARVQTQGTSATGPAWSSPTGTAPAYVENSAVITFPAATGDWASGANMTYFGIFSAASAGTVQIFGNLTTAKPVLNGDTASFAASAIRVQLGDPGDTYT